MTLLEFYGPMFEVEHKYCTCELSRLIVSEHREFNYAVVYNRCDFCGLEIHAREMKNVL